MPAAENAPYQKLKLLYLAKIFHEQTDEEHALSVYDLSEKLAADGISGTRKTLSADIELLKLFGMDIITVKNSKMNAYYLGERLFEQTELKLLADSISSSRFITGSKSRKLLKKIENLTNKYDAVELDRQVFISNRVKSDNELIYINVDKITRAINSNCAIKFRYFDYGPDKKKKYRDGDRACSPYALTWNDGNYYLVAFYEKYGNITNFRVDRMRDIEILEEKRTKLPKEFDLVQYMSTCFSMFSGEAESVKLRFAGHLTNPVIDRFGTDVMMIPEKSGHFTVNVKVIPGKPFFGWLFQFGTDAEILYPDTVKERYSKMLNDVMGKYSKQ